MPVFKSIRLSCYLPIGPNLLVCLDQMFIYTNTKQKPTVAWSTGAVTTLWKRRWWRRNCRNMSIVHCTTCPTANNLLIFCWHSAHVDYMSNCQMHTLCNRTIVYSRQEYMQVQHTTCNLTCAHMHESSSWECVFCSKSGVIYKVVKVSSLLSPSLSRRQSRSLLPSVTLETNQHLRSIAAIQQIGQIFCILFKTGRSSCFKCERNEMIQDGGLCPLNPDCVAVHSLLDLPFTGSYLTFMSDHCLALSVMRQCQIRVRFESRGRLFFKALVKRLWMAKYAPIIIIWCIERGFYKRITWSPVLGVFTNALITWQRKYLY